MARIFQDGFEMGRPSGVTATFGAYQGGLWQFNCNLGDIMVVDAQTSVKNSGNYALRMIHDLSSYRTQVFRNLGADLSEFFDRVEYRLATSNGTTEVVHYRDTAFNVVASIRISTTLDLLVYIGSSHVGTIAGAFIGGVFNRIETHLVIDSVEGMIEVKVNGNSHFVWAGNTDPLGTGHVRSMCLGKILSSSVDFTSYYDDVAVNDTTGSVNNSWCGKGSILLLRPKGVGHYSQFTPSNVTFDNYEMVDEIPNDSDTTYVQSDTVGNIDTYDMQELVADRGIDPALGVVVKAVQVCLTGRYEGADSSLAPILRSGVVDSEGALMEMASIYHRVYDQVFSVSPFTGLAWTYAGVDLLEAGVKQEEHPWG